jgi:oligopeptide transport system permease protein
MSEIHRPEARVEPIDSTITPAGEPSKKVE